MRDQLSIERGGDAVRACAETFRTLETEALARLPVDVARLLLTISDVAAKTIEKLN